MTTRHELHHLVDELSDSALVPAEAFLSFLRDRARPNKSPSDRPTEHEGAQSWADSARLGLDQRRRDRDTGGDKPDVDDGV